MFEPIAYDEMQNMGVDAENLEQKNLLWFILDSSTSFINPLYLLLCHRQLVVWKMR